mmetsp:Transcript_35827/g.65719  ORF Transcript_35827/g.65719 Transcript_35827/m.65719 type:complete len:268 (-) Transcript_35827:610-1413(-)
MGKKKRSGRASRAAEICLLLPLAIASLVPHTNGWSFEKAMVNWVKSSTLFADLHQEHVSSSQVRHMMKSTPLVDAPDEAKIKFANGPFGKMVARMMESEQTLLGDWKLEKIVEAAGEDFDEDEGHRYLLEVLDRSPVTLFSFVDCPWCLLAKKLLEDEYNVRHDDGSTLQIIELEDLGRDGKKLRAAVAVSTGRTSMPACFINKKSVGGYTDGFMNAVLPDNDDPNNVDSGFKYVPTAERDLRCIGSPGLKKLHERGELATLLRDVY